MLKKFLALSMILGSMTFAVISAEAKTATATAAGTVELNAAPQWQRNRNRRNRSYNSRVRVVNTTRIVRVGRRVYRETIQTRYLPNGRTQTRVISRVRVR